jgi:hypothetical protein
MNTGIKMSHIPRLPDDAEMLIAENWSGWFWKSNVAFHMLWRYQGDTGGNYVIFQKFEHYIQYIDELGGLIEHKGV